MDFYNRHFHRLVRHLDSHGMLNVPFNVTTNAACIRKYFRTDSDFRKLDVPWMCDQLIILLIDLDNNVAISSSLPFLENDFQRFRYPLILICHAFIGIVLLHESSIQVFYGYCKTSIISLYKTKITLDKKKKRKKKSNAINNNDINQSQQVEIIQNQPIGQLELNQVVRADHENINIDTNVILEPSLQVPLNQNDVLIFNNKEDIGSNGRKLDSHQQQPIEEFPIPDQNLLFENLPLPSSVMGHIMNEEMQSSDVEMLRSIEQPRYSLNILDKENEAVQLLKQPDTSHPQDQQNQVQQLTGKDVVHVQEKDQVSTENNVSRNILLNRPVKRKNSVINKVLKKRPIELSKKVLKTRMKKLEGELLDRPLECMYNKYINKSVDHLPLRYAMHGNQLNIPFRVITLNYELEQNKDHEDKLNNTIDMINYEAITDKLNNDSVNKSIYQQAVNNLLPHLSLIPPAEEGSSDNSLEWRNTINEINRKLGDTSNISKIEQERLKYRIHQSLVTQRTLIDPEIPHVDVPINVAFPSLYQTEEMFNSNLIVEPQNAPMMLHANVENDRQALPIIVHNGAPKLIPDKFPDQLNINDVNNQLVSTNVQDLQNNVESARVSQKQSIDVMQMLTNNLKQHPENSHLRFTDLCPLHTTERKCALSVMNKLLQLHKEKVIKLSQPYNTSEPSSISIELLFLKS